LVAEDQAGPARSRGLGPEIGRWLQMLPDPAAASEIGPPTGAPSDRGATKTSRSRGCVRAAPTATTASLRNPRGESGTARSIRMNA